MVSEYNAALRQLQDSKSLKRSKYNPRAKYWPIDALFEKIRIDKFGMLSCTTAKLGSCANEFL
jgi:hypothetical protein